MKLGLKLDEKSVLKAQEKLKDVQDGYEKACSRAINRTLQGMRKDAVQLTREEYTVKATPLRKSITIKRANAKNLNGTFISRGERLGLMHFNVRPQTDTTGNKRRKVRAEVKRGERFEVPRGFVWNRNVFQRVGRERLPIDRQTGRSAPEMMEDDAVFDSLADGANQKLKKRLAHETEAILRGFTNDRK